MLVVAAELPVILSRRQLLAFIRDRGIGCLVVSYSAVEACRRVAFAIQKVEGKVFATKPLIVTVS